MNYDFVIAERNKIAALYIANPKILEMDGICQSKPFLFQLNGGSLKDTITTLPVYVGRKPELEEIIEGREVRKVLGGHKGASYPVPFSCMSERKSDIFTCLVDKEGIIREDQGIRTDLDSFKETLAAYDALQRTKDSRAVTHEITELPTLGFIDWLRRFLLSYKS